MSVRFFLTFIYLFLFFSCQSSSLEEFHYEGVCQTRLLLGELKNIETSSDLLLAESLLKKRFEKIVDVAIRARSFQQKHPRLEIVHSQESEMLSDALLEEMRRIYSLEGGRECIERAQREAMLRLDAKEKALEKSQSRFN